MSTHDETKNLLRLILGLHEDLRKTSKKEFNRINPFVEDLFDWRERGQFWNGEDKNVTIYNSTTVVGDVEIGENTWIGPYCALDGTGGLSIGSYCSISQGCQLLSHETVKWALSGGRVGYDYSPVRIGDCCFLGVNAIVLKGVTIGSHCLVAAGAVVTKDVPDHSIVAGVPAKMIGNVSIIDSGEVTLQYNI